MPGIEGGKVGASKHFFDKVFSALSIISTYLFKPNTAGNITTDVFLFIFLLILKN